MKKSHKTNFFIFSLILTFIFLPTIAFANPNSQLTPHPVSYEIYDESGKLVESGVLPLSENELSSRESYSSKTLVNGQTMILKNPYTNKPFDVLPNKQMQLKFALDRTANMRVMFWDDRYNTTIGSIWQGLTGGLSISRTTPSNRDSYVQVEIKNYSSDPVTVLWATLDF